MMNVSNIIKRLGIDKKLNVVGYSTTLKPKVVGGKTTQINSIRIYVKRKLPYSCISKEDLIPPIVAIEGMMIPTDVIEVGEVKALEEGNVDKTKKFRPVKLGVSVGHYFITAGSLGMLYNKVDTGGIFAGSNAHVLTDDASKSPEQVIEKRILQPAPYHQGKVDEDVVGYYYWHKQIYPQNYQGSPCKLGNTVAKIMNTLPRILGRKGRFMYMNEPPTNKIDFAVYKPAVEHSLEVADGCLTDKDPFIGHLFAGSDTIGGICKVKHIIAEGYVPLCPVAEVAVGDKVRGCSFWCHYTTEVIDESAVLDVSYGNFVARFEDIILVKNDGTIRGGYSGSGWRKVV